ncbi:MAG: LacI family DNA-binding transcriptional regulator [Chthoniobacterales bacterium]
MPTPTLKEIAAELGVSHTLVSCVASGRMGNTRVSEKKRQFILKRIQEVGFRPNRLALALKGGRKGYVSVFLHKHGVFGSELNEQFISTISDSLMERGLGLWLRFFTSEQEFLEACSPRLIQEVDGLIVAGTPHPEMYDSLQKLQKRGIAVVCTFANRKSANRIPCVSIDFEKQGRLAAEHLLEMGCSRIARIHTLKERQEGFLKGLRSAGAKVNHSLMLKTEDYTYDEALQYIDKLVRSGKRFDGVSTDSDAQAAAVVHYFLRLGMPKDRWPKVVGIDDSPIARHCVIPLTSVTSEIRDRARHVTQLLFDCIDKKKVKSVVVTPKLVVRESTDSSRISNYFDEVTW